MRRLRAGAGAGAGARGASSPGTTAQPSWPPGYMVGLTYARPRRPAGRAAVPSPTLPRLSPSGAAEQYPGRGPPWGAVSVPARVSESRPGGGVACSGCSRLGSIRQSGATGHRWTLRAVAKLGVPTRTADDVVGGFLCGRAFSLLQVFPRGEVSGPRVTGSCRFNFTWTDHWLSWLLLLCAPRVPASVLGARICDVEQQPQSPAGASVRVSRSLPVRVVGFVAVEFGAVFTCSSDNSFVGYVIGRAEVSCFD